eukprot:COSAG06_NODE_2440_length_6872_cov_135.458586_5_plen_142_part_00
MWLGFWPRRWQRGGLDTRAVAPIVQRHRPAVLAAQPRRHHPEPLVVLVDGHGALVEVEEHADAVAHPRALHALPVLPAGAAETVARVVKAVAVHTRRVLPSLNVPDRLDQTEEHVAAHHRELRVVTTRTHHRLARCGGKGK